MGCDGHELPSIFRDSSYGLDFNLTGRKFGHHVEFDIYVITNLTLREIGNSQGCRDDHDFHNGPRRLIRWIDLIHNGIHSQADAVDANRSFGNHKTGHGFF